MKARVPKAPAIRFRIDPAYAPEDKVARRLSLTLDQFVDCRRRLYARGFPAPDETTGMYDLEAVERWCAKNEGRLPDLGVALAGPSLAEVAKSWKGAEPKKPIDTAIIYIVGFGDYVKIGFTTLPIQYRLRALQTACPEKLNVYATFPGNAGLERALHSRFARQRLNGEWFRLDNRIRQWIAAGCPHG